jgi:hypothetical protein
MRILIKYDEPRKTVQRVCSAVSVACGTRLNVNCIHSIQLRTVAKRNAVLWDVAPSGFIMNRHFFRRNEFFVISKVDSGVSVIWGYLYLCAPST